MQEQVKARLRELVPATRGSCDAVLVRFSWILAEFGRILTQNCNKIEVPRGTGILLRSKTESQLINELISEDLFSY